MSKFRGRPVEGKAVSPVERSDKRRFTNTRLASCPSPKNFRGSSILQSQQEDNIEKSTLRLHKHYSVAYIAVFQLKINVFPLRFAQREVFRLGQRASSYLSDF